MECRQKSALHHILNYSYCLKAHGLASCVRTGNYKYSSVGVETQIQRYDFPALFTERKEKHRVYRMEPVDVYSAFDYRHLSVHIEGEPCLGPDEIEQSEELNGFCNFLYVGTY